MGLISRQAAIDSLERIFNCCEEIEANLPDGDPDKTGYDMFPDYMTVWRYLHQLSSAERRGHWIKKNGMYECSECGVWFPHRSAYCRDCGAKMDEVSE